MKGERTARQELEEVLDPAHAQAVLDHRIAKRAKLTPHAAALLAKQFARWTDPNAAADEMISRGWQGFKAEWVEPPKTVPVSAHRPPTKIPEFVDPPPDVRERMINRFNALSSSVAAHVAMDKPRRVMPRGIR